MNKEYVLFKLAQDLPKPPSINSNQSNESNLTKLIDKNNKKIEKSFQQSGSDKPIAVGSTELPEMPIYNKGIADYSSKYRDYKPQYEAYRKDSGGKFKDYKNQFDSYKNWEKNLKN